MGSDNFRLERWLRRDVNGKARWVRKLIIVGQSHVLGTVVSPLLCTFRNSTSTNLQCGRSIYVFVLEEEPTTEVTQRVYIGVDNKIQVHLTSKNFHHSYQSQCGFCISLVIEHLFC